MSGILPAAKMSGSFLGMVFGAKLTTRIANAGYAGGILYSQFDLFLILNTGNRLSNP
jgi:hypothetical protein